MAFSFDSFRKLFTGQRSEHVQQSFTPASKEEIGPNRSHSSQVLLDKGLEMNASIQRESPEQKEEGPYSLEAYLEKGLLPGLSPDEEPSEQSYSTKELRQAAKLVAQDVGGLQAKHPKLNSEQLFGIVRDQDQANSASVERPTTAFSLLADQEKSIREEWQQDLRSGRHNQHDLETYFAGKIDQHNTMIELAVEANPKLQETLPPHINYEQLRSEIQQQIQQQQQAPAQAMEMAI